MNKVDTPKILITGAKGQLGQSFKKIENGWPLFEFHFFDREALDITDRLAVTQVMEELKPFALINCAAYTAVDLAETEVEMAYKINETAVSDLANCCNDRDVFFVHYSSDYVYHNDLRIPLSEENEATPKGEYAKSKYAGEKQILDSLCPALILRTSWVYSEFGSNFVKTMIALGKRGISLKVVNDQIGAPTYAPDIASTTMKIIHQQFSGQVKIEQPTIINYASEGELSWLDLALYIFQCARMNVDVTGVTTEEYGSVAPRPLWSMLDMTKIKSIFGIAPRYWKECVKECVDLILKSDQKV